MSVVVCVGVCNICIYVSYFGICMLLFYSHLLIDLLKQIRTQGKLGSSGQGPAAVFLYEPTLPRFEVILGQREELRALVVAGECFERQAQAGAGHVLALCWTTLGPSIASSPCWAASCRIRYSRAL